MTGRPKAGILVAGLLTLGSIAYADQALTSGADAVAASELIEHARALDGERVVFQGEAVGEVFPRGGHSWINLSDGTAAIGIWVEASSIPEDAKLGSWKGKGAVFRVAGTFHRACVEHGGDLDIHADTFVLVFAGTSTERPLEPFRISLACLATVAASCAGLLYRKSRLRSRGKSAAEGGE